MIVRNKKAKHNYHILETIEAGIVLTGKEVKSVRAGRVDLSQSFARIGDGQISLKNGYIYPYQSQDQDYNPRRDRKLLLHKRELNSLIGKISGSAKVLVPLSIYTTRNFIKVELALAISKKKYDKRRAAKERDEKRKIEQELKVSG